MSDFLVRVFDADLALPLKQRAETMRKLLECMQNRFKVRLDVCMVETNTCRWPPDWEADGHSTGVLDAFLHQCGAGTLYSIDADAETSACMRTHTRCPGTRIICADPVEWLLSWSQGSSSRVLDLLYLTSANMDWENEHDAEFQHVKEFFAAKSMLRADSLVVVDGSSARCRYLLQLMQELNASTVFESDWQRGWMLRDRVPCIVNVTFRLDKYGMAEDMQVLQDLIASASKELASSSTSSSSLVSPPLVRRVPVDLARLRYDVQLADVNVFLEQTDESRFASAPINVWVPNVEYFHDKHFAALTFVDHVFAKTRWSHAVMQRLMGESRARFHLSPEEPRCRVHYTGFTSADCAIPELWPTRNWDEVLFLAGGNSERRQVKTVLETWRQHSELPPLTMVCQTLSATDAQTASALRHVRVIDQYVPRVCISEMENHFGLHLCSTQAEGFGHSINEVRACAAVAIASDGPPMNELVDDACGVLIPCTRATTCNWFNECAQIPRCEIAPAQLHQALTTALRLSTEQKRDVGQRARQRYLEERAQLSARFPSVWSQVADDCAHRSHLWLRALHANPHPKKVVNYRHQQPSLWRRWQREDDGNVLCTYEVLPAAGGAEASSCVQPNPAA